MPTLAPKLEIERCPHCSVARPDLTSHQTLKTNNHSGGFLRMWKVYVCSTCGGVVIAWSPHDGYEVQEIFPQTASIDNAIPSVARSYLTQATQSVHAPAGAVMLAASAVDSMLKEKNYKTGSLYSRIEKAASEYLITQEMAQWAHQVRLDANDQRHADEDATLPTETDAKRCI